MSRALSPTLRRVLAIPRQTDLPTAETPRTDALAPRLLPIQVRVLADLEARAGEQGVGGFYEVGAGHGKTLPSFLAGYVLGARRTLLIVPAALVDKTHRALAHWRSIFPEFPADLHVLSADRVSHRKHASILHNIGPDLIVLDEAHTFTGDSARTRRLLDYVNTRPETRVVYLSGTLGGKPLANVASAMHVALRDTSPAPFPHDRNVLDTWASVLDKGAKPASDVLEHMAPLASWAGKPATQDGIREAWRERRTSAPGVVATSEDAVGASLELTYWRSKLPPPPALVKALERLSQFWELPDGTELVEALQFQRYAATLGAGFWYRTVYGAGESVDSEVVRTWMDVRAEWSRQLRRQILYRSCAGMDSPACVVEAILRGEGSKDLRAAYAAWEAVRPRLTVTREVEWLWPDLVDDAITFARAQGRCMIWYASVAMGDALRARGMPVFGRGSAQPPANIDVPCASIGAHGTGKDLQAWDTALVLEFPQGANGWEQLLARHHRHGQASDTVLYHVHGTLWPSRGHFQAALKSAKWIESVTCQPQRLNFSTWR